MFTLNTSLIPELNRNGISFRYIVGASDNETIIVTNKTTDVCRIDLNRDQNKTYNYDVYWFSVFRGIRWLRKEYVLSGNLITDILKVINLKGDENMKVRVESVNMDFTTASMINGPIESDYTIKVHLDGFDPSFSIRVKKAIERMNYSNSKTNMYDDYYNYLVGRTIDWRKEYEKERYKFDIKDVIFNDPATIVLWADGTKTVVKAENEPFDPEKGLAMAISKRALGNKYDYYDTFKKYVGRYEKKQKKG